MFELPPLAAAVLLLALGLTGGLVFKLLKLPAPLILGPMVAVSLGNLAELPFPLLPAWFENIAQVVLGFYLGAGITQGNLKELKAIFFPAAATAVWSMVITFGLGFFLYKITPLNLATAVLSSSPGGAPEVSIIALSVNADVATVTVMQMARLLAILIMAPCLSKIARAMGKTAVSRSHLEHYDPAILEPTLPVYGYNSQIRHFIAGLLNPGLGIALVGGLVFYYLGVPAGYMIGSMIAVGTASVCGLKIRPLPNKIRAAALIGIGVLIGQFFTRDALSGIADIYPVVLLLTGLMLLLCASLAVVLSMVMGWKMSVCLLATAPGGLITMIALAEEMGSDPLKVSLLHLARLITVKLTLPLVILIIY